MLDKVKMLLGIQEADMDKDDQLRWIISSAEARLRNLLGGGDIPDTLSHIIVEVSVIRYNRIGSEGVGIHIVEGEHLQFNSNDFSGFMDEINAYLDMQDQSSKRGGFMFI